ncbi:putative repeat protein (TIGR01451 family) [Microbacterium sp. ZKA21]|uniref:DUF7507 domain-containing protein n=1 Tax=Microbacterium sp. ZKA21 TaxID=3381694 RepID=UPI003D24D78D
MPSETRTRTFRGAALAISAVLLTSMLGIVVDAAAPAPAVAAQDPTVCQDSVALVNGGFEQPTVAAGRYQLFDESAVPGWFTNDVQNKIEIWNSGFNNVPSAEGRQFAELNAYSASRLYQDVATTPGQTLSWSLQHRGRQGTDVMRVLIGPPASPVQSGPNLSDGLSWGTHAGTYVVPAGQTTTRFAFEAVSSAGGNAGVGNFLDDITFGTGPCLISDKTVENVTSGAPDAEVGDVLRYTVTTRNDGGNPARTTVATDVLDPGLDFVPGSLRIVSGTGAGALTDAAGDDRGEYTTADRTVRVRLGDAATSAAGGAIPAGSSTSYTFDARVNLAGAATTIENEAQVAFRDDIVGQDRVSTTQTTETPVGDAADLEIVKTLHTAPLVAGEPVSYTLVVTNNGPQAVDDFSVYDPIPAVLSDVQVETTSGSCVVTASMNCAGGPLGVDESAEITITGTLSADAPAGSAVVNTAQVESATTDPDQSNNTSTASGTVTSAADVSIAKSFEPENPVAGEQVTYTLTASNAGPSAAADVLLTDPLDPETTFVSAESDAGTCTLDEDGTAVSCAIGTLAPGQTVEARVTVTLDPDAEVAVQNTATITTSTSDSDSGDNASSASFEPTVTADLAVTKDVSAATVTAGDAFTYTIGVENIGPSTAENVVLSDTVPAGITVEEVIAPPGATCTVTGSAVRCDWDQLGPEETATVEIQASVQSDAPAGTLINTASVAAPTEDTDTTNNSDSATITVEQSADVGVEKTATPTTGVPGTAQSFTITVTNHGPSTARGVTVADFLPAGFDDVTTSTEGCRIVGTVGVCELGDLGPDESRTVTIDGAIASDAVGSITNTTTAASATPDPNADNYSASVVVPLAPSADISLTKTTSTPEVALDGEVQYLVTVRNDGPSDALGVVVEDVAEDGIALGDAVASAGTWSGGTWTVGILQPGEEETLAVTGIATAEGTFTNTATASSETADPDSGDLIGTADVVVAASADLAITKTVSADPAPLNGELSYTLTVENLGPNDASGVVVTDQLPAALIDPVTTSPGCEITGAVLTCELAALADGDTAEFVVTGTVDPSTSAADITNTAGVTATEADPDPDNNSSTVTTPISGEGAIEIFKTATPATDTNGDGRIGAGDEVTYSFTVRNTGPTTLSGVAVSDPLLGGPVDCPAFDDVTLAPQDEVDCGPIPYTLTQADVDRGGVVNTASVSATSPRGPVSDDDTITLFVPAVNGVSLDKTAGEATDVDGDGSLGAGDTVQYAFTVTNTGSTTLAGIALTDEMLGGFVECQNPGGLLAPGATVDCGPVTYTLTQDDVDAGSVHNTATVTALSPAGPITDTAEADATIDGTDAIELRKTVGAVTDVDGDGRYGEGDEIEYAFTVINGGTTTVTLDALTDATLGGDLGCFAEGAVTLAPTESADCGPVAYAITQEDIDAGVVDNTATVEGDGLEPVQDDGSAQVMIAGAPRIDLLKTATAPVDADGDGMIGTGDEVSYSFTVTNTGTTTLTDVAIDDPLLGGALDCAALEDLSLAPGDDVECGPVVYALTQQDVDAETVHNDATVAAQSSAGEARDAASTDTPIAGTDAIELVKTAGAPTDVDGDGRIGAGDTVDYSFTVTNTGTTTLTAAAIDDALLGGALECPDLASAVLAPGDDAACGPVAYALTQEDVDAGVVRNTASVSATSPSGSVTDDAETTVTIAAANGVSLVKTAGLPVDADGDGALGAGDTIEYSFAITNTGTTTLSGVVVTDPMLGGVVDCAAADGAVLAPGASVSCAPVVYTLTQEDVDDGTVRNTAIVDAEAPSGGVSDTAATETTIDSTTAITLVKTALTVADTTGDGRIGAGDEVSFTFAVTNVGTTTVTDAEIEDPLLGGMLDCPTLADASIAPGEAIECGPFVYALTQEDIDAGVVHNEATVTAGTASDDASIDVIIGGADGIALDKLGAAPIDTTGDGRIGAGDEVAFTFTVRNTGTTVLRDLQLDDPLLGGAVDCPALDGAELAPGAAIECGPVAYVLTQDDVDAQTVHNEATTTGSGLGSVDAVASADVAVAGHDGIALVKSAAAIEDANGNGVTDAGDTIDYTFAVTNTGTTTVSNVAIADARVDGEIVCEATSIAPGEMVLCGPVTVALTQGDIDAAEVVNTATASAVGAGGSAVTVEAGVTTPIDAQPAVSVEKSGGDYADANGDAKVSAGDTIQFRFAVTNTGAVTITDATIVDPKLGGDVACDVPDLAPGESFTCGPVAYTITAEEAQARSVTNAATVTAISGTVTVTASDSVTVELPELAVTGGVVIGLGWAILLIALGLLGMLIARVRRTRLV